MKGGEKEHHGERWTQRFGRKQESEKRRVKVITKLREEKDFIQKELYSLKEQQKRLMEGDEGDRSAIAQLAIQDSRRFDDLNMRLKQVQSAINRFKKDKHIVLCEGCGNPIPEERLRVCPWTTKCVPCLSEAESLARVRGIKPRGFALA